MGFEMIGQGRQVADRRPGMPTLPLFARRRQSLEADPEQLRQKLRRSCEQSLAPFEWRSLQPGGH